jgi:hypothetical protein
MFVCVPGHAADIPDALKPWEEWVLHNQEEKVCPPAFNDRSDHRCCWPTDLALNLGAGSYPFEAKNPGPILIAASAATIHIATQSCSLAKSAMTATIHREMPPKNAGNADNRVAFDLCHFDPLPFWLSSPLVILAQLIRKQ